MPPPRGTSHHDGTERQRKATRGLTGCLDFVSAQALHDALLLAEAPHSA
ncbi:hypothetical protein ABT168_12960 [Streptomyces sp. NPDC001793]